MDLKTFTASGQRGLVVLEGCDVTQVRSLLNLCHIKGRVLWVHSKKGGLSRQEQQEVDGVQFETCWHRDDQRVLGSTFAALIVDGFQGVTPNGLCKCVETVGAGGLIIFNVRRSNKECEAAKKLTTSSLNSLFGSSGYFLTRLITSLKQNAVALDWNLKPLVSWEAPRFYKTLRRVRKDDSNSTNDSQRGEEYEACLCANPDQAKICREFAAFFQGSKVKLNDKKCKAKKRKLIMWLTAARGRGKSASLGLLAAKLTAAGESVTVLAPELRNIAVLMHFYEVGLNYLNLSFVAEKEKSRVTYQLQNSKLRCLSVDCLSWDDVANNVPFQAASSLLLIDEAASIPTPLVQHVVKSVPAVLLSSTVTGYEGTGRSLALKLHNTFQADPTVDFLSLTLSTPIRYKEGDYVEEWLYTLLCIPQNALTVQEASCVIEAPKTDLRIFEINKAFLFSFKSKASRKLLANVMELFAESHYRNSPDDLLLLSDNPTHALFVLVANVDHEDPKALSNADILCALQIAFEGGMDKQRARDCLHSRGGPAAGDLVPCKLVELSRDSTYAEMIGARVVRIAVSPRLQRQGLGTRCLQLLTEYLETAGVEPRESGAVCTNPLEALETDALPVMPPTLPVKVEYVATSFGLTTTLLKFWSAEGFKAVAVSHQRQEKTGEYSAVFVRSLKGHGESQVSFGPFHTHCLGAFVELLPDAFRTMSASLATQFILHLNEKDESVTPLFTEWERATLAAYVSRQLERSAIRSLWRKLLSYWVSKRKPSLSPLQQVIVVALGGQKKTIDALALELNCKSVQILGHLETIVSKFVAELKNVQPRCPSPGPPAKKYKNL